MQIPTDRTSGTRTRATEMLTYKFVEIYSTPLTTAPRRLVVESPERKPEFFVSKELSMQNSTFCHMGKLVGSCRLISYYYFYK